jgi:hypothetical protein
VLQALGEGRRPVEVPGGDEYLGAGGVEAGGDLRADRARSADHEDSLAFKGICGIHAPTV